MVFLTESVLAGVLFLNLVQDIETFRLFTLFYAAGALVVCLFCALNPDLFFVSHGRLTLGEEFNPNTLGVMVMFGGWCMIFGLNGLKSNYLTIILALVLSVLFLYIITLTASRKAILGFAFIALAWVIFLLFGGGKKAYFFKKIAGVILLASVVVYFFGRYGGDLVAAGDVAAKRFDTLEEGVTDRGYIIKESWHVFLNHPIFGVGLDNNRYHTVSGLYAHNSYLEILACTGILGAIIFYPLYFKMLGFLVKYTKKFKILMRNTVVMFTCVLIVVYLFIGYGQIHMYNQNLMFIMYFILALIRLVNPKSSTRLKLKIQTNGNM